MFLDFIFCNLDLNLYNSCFLSLPFLTYLDLSLAASCVHMVDMSTTHTCSFGSKFVFVAYFWNLAKVKAQVLEKVQVLEKARFLEKAQVWEGFGKSQANVQGRTQT